MSWKPGRIASRAVTVGLLVCAVVIGASIPASFAGGTRSGDAVPTDPQSNASVTSGGSSTAWTLKLPSGAACSGDTATHAYHVYSFIVPAAVDPGTLVFNPSTGPSQGLPLVDATGSSFMAANTAQTTGQVVQVPAFNLTLFATTDQGGARLALPPGYYNVGLACANTLGQGDKYWSSQFTFVANTSDPNGEVWTDHSSSTSTSAGGNGLALPIGIAAVACVAYFVHRGRRRTKAAAAA
jgi:hypothetical protein